MRSGDWKYVKTVQEGRRQRAEDRRNLEGDCDPSQLEAPKSLIWEGLQTLTPLGRGQRAGDIPSASCLLPSAFFGEQEFLFNLVTEDREEIDLQANHIDIFERLRGEYQQWESELIPYQTAD